jgi:monoamine oxidase
MYVGYRTAIYGSIECHFQKGVAGLTIAYELTRAGHQVVVYEATDRPGGRLLIEMGAMRLPLKVHTLLNKYVRHRFNLPIEPFQSNDPNTLIYINGIRRRRSNTTFYPVDFHFQVNETEQKRVRTTSSDMCIK